MKLDIVVAGYIVNNDRLLLIHHKKLEKWLPVGGHIKKNEIPDDALKREVKEEVGINVSFMNYPLPRLRNHFEFAIPFYTNTHPISKNHAHYCLFYLCKPKSLDIKINKKEVLNYGWFGVRELESFNPPLDKENLETCLEAIYLEKITNEITSDKFSFFLRETFQ